MRGVRYKKCNECFENKKEEIDFYKSGRGYEFICKSCRISAAINNKKNNKERYARYSANRNALIKALPRYDHRKATFDSYRYFNYKCALTNTRGDLVDDHFIAIATGHGGTIRGNIIPLLSAINFSKNDADPFTWFETNRQRFELDDSRWNALISYLADQNGLTLDEYRQFVDWCYANQRSIDDIRADNERYGYVVSSLELWREATGMSFPLRIDFRQKRRNARDRRNHFVGIHEMV
ncbi:hypothetical protein GCM10010916_01550 [Paenibacillus abyssi]|uniref:Uncharacterized protein n=1 Tax=Paenibacillus abyssi TaxID=1340531 RepID=A0A917CHF5_9BACL|nr:hypothetical protein GCM10010916_01550 [Paenibacillus abyssi]